LYSLTALPYEPANPLQSWRAKQGQALISEVYLSARQLIVLELGATTSHIQASTETLTHRKPNYVPFVQEPNLLAIEDEFAVEDDF
jgi:hypothetical protein